MIPTPEPRRLWWKWVALAFTVLVLALLAAVNFGLIDAWIVRPREAAEREQFATTMGEARRCTELGDQLTDELQGQNEQAVIALFGQPQEKINVELVSDGTTRPRWRYEAPRLAVSFLGGRVQRVEVESSQGFNPELLATLSAPGKVPNGTERNLYPLKAGNKWEYGLKEYGDRDAQVTVTVEVLTVESKNGRLVANLTATTVGEATQKETVASDDHGVYRDGVAGLNSEREFPIVKYPVKRGETWNETVRFKGADISMAFEVGTARTVRVPAGKFIAIPIAATGRIADTKVKSTKWFADGVGIVKEDFDRNDRSYIRELMKFTPGK